MRLGKNQGAIELGESGTRGRAGDGFSDEKSSARQSVVAKREAIIRKGCIVCQDNGSKQMRSLIRSLGPADFTPAQMLFGYMGLHPFTVVKITRR
jgi:hypothetical protein